MCQRYIVPAILILVLLFVLPAAARITYVDANDGPAGNTTLAAGGVFQAVDVPTAGSGEDGLWRIRAFANEGTIFESGGSWDGVNTEDCPRLVTTVDVPENDYVVYAYMWSDGDVWRMRASLTDDPNQPLPLFVANDPNGAATVAHATDFAAPIPLLTEDNRTLWQVPLGTTGMTTSIQVYIDDDPDPNQSSGNFRTWYDGIGYDIAPPRINYVDANDGPGGNTTLADGSLFQAVDVPTAGSGEDGLWRIRAFANEGTIFESGGSWDGVNTEDCPRLMTTVEVPEGYYDVYAYMWSDGDVWRMRASLTNDPNQPLPLFVAGDPNGAATVAQAADFEAPIPLLTEGGRTLWQVPLGSTGQLTPIINVYIDDDPDPNQTSGSFRTWYDGIGYKAISPIIYVDANDGPEGNTALATGDVFNAVDVPTAGSGEDGLWRIRAFANEGTIFEAGGSWDGLNTEDCPRLMTTVEVPEGYYDVYAYMWSDGDVWRMKASLTEDPNDPNQPLPLFVAGDPNGAATVAQATDFAAPIPMLNEGGRTLWQVPLGPTADRVTSISVYIDDDPDPNQTSGSFRTWYDGIGYSKEFE